MGGNALKNTQTRRLARDEFERVEKLVAQRLSDVLPGLRVAGVPAYRTKPDFGDLDLMVTLEPLEQASAHVREQYRRTASGQVVTDPTQAAWHGYMQELVHREFGATETYPNGNVLSFDYHADPKDPVGFQVDVIAMREQNFDYALDYYSYNDLGNLIGRTAAKMGLEHGHRGLLFTYMEGTHQVAEIVLTRDYDQALAFLGYDPKRFREGFESLENIFSYVAGSAYFNADIFLLENRNTKARERDKKRTTYQSFLAWCAARELPRFEYPEGKGAWLGHIAAHFPHFEREFEQVQQGYQDWREAKNRYNGTLVSQWTGLQGMALNRLMEQVKTEAGGVDGLRKAVLGCELEQLRERVRRVAAAMAQSSA